MLICSCSSKEEYFSGELVYNYTYNSPNFDADSISAERPSKGVFRYDKFNYQSQFITKADSLSYFYISSRNLAIAKNHKSDQWRCENYGVSTDSVLSYKYYDTETKILGHSCKILEFKSRFANNKYYISTDQHLNTNLYKNHEAYNWKFYGDKTDGGLILKLEHHFSDHSMIGNVESIQYFKPQELAIKEDLSFLLNKCGL